MKIKDGEIIPGVSIGEIRLDMTREELLSVIGSDYKERILSIGYTLIEVENAKFWVSKKYNRLNQIGVRNNFKGRYKNLTIEIGSTLKKLTEHLGNYVDYEYEDVYEIENIPGLCFELRDDEEDDESEDWGEAEILSTPIERIFVYGKNWDLSKEFD